MNRSLLLALIKHILSILAAKKKIEFLKFRLWSFPVSLPVNKLLRLMGNNEALFEHAAFEGVATKLYTSFINNVPEMVHYNNFSPTEPFLCLNWFQFCFLAVDVV